VPYAPTARLISTATGRQIGPVLKLGEPERREDEPWAAFSPDGRTAYIVYPENQVQRWDLAKGARLTPDFIHPGEVEDMQFSRDGKIALTIGDGDARVWDAAAGSSLGKTFETGRRDAAALSPDGGKVVGLNAQGQLVVAAIGRKKALYKVKTDRQNAGRIEAVAFSPDSRYLVTVGNVIGVWNAAGGKLLAQGGRHTSPSRVVFSPAGDVFVVVEDNRVQLWKTPAP
jgi:WD40 repeat protein